MKRDDTGTVPAPASTTRPTPSFTDQLIEPLSRLRSEVDRLFDDFPFRMPTMSFGRFMSAAAPAVEMKETAKSYKITAELPGMEPDDVEVSFDDGMLRIAGEKTEEHEENERGFRLSERRYGAFERVLELPAAADGEDIKARFKNGVLTVMVPKDAKAERKPRRIAVEKA